VALLKAFLQRLFTVDRRAIRPLVQAQLRAQLRAFSKQIPLLYAILLANTAFVSATHFSLRRPSS
jgi:predicted signal transduction protein with EAL and GGDEF domain